VVSFFLSVLIVVVAPAGWCGLIADDQPRKRGTSASSEKSVNLLRLLKVKLEETTAPASDRAALKALTDNDPGTVAQISLDKNSTVDITYGFGGDIVTVERLVIHVPSPTPSGASTARVEILVSTLSAQAGFQSVRADALKPTSQAQEFSFPPTAAGWILLRFTAGENAKRVAVAEVAVFGHEGPPVTHYAFKESPAQALDVLAKLKDSSSVNVRISPDEANLFADVIGGKFTKWSFAEAALLASGDTDPQKRKEHLEKLETLERQVRQAIDDATTSLEKGEKLLGFLHSKSGPLAKGYRGQQTNLSDILDAATYNCVSSAVLYNVLGRRLNLDVRAIEVPSHAFSILYDGTRHADVETTTASGFNPARDPVAQKEFEAKTGFRYIPDMHRDQRREVGEAGLVALIYYNHGVTLTREKRHQEALLAYFRAMSLDPEFLSAVKNALGELASWGLELSRQGKHKEAVDVVSAGLELAPQDAALRSNIIFVYQEGGKNLLASGKSKEAVAWIDSGIKRYPDRPELKGLKGGLFLNQSMRLIRAKNWPAAADTLATARELVPEDKAINQNLGYLTQESLRQIHAKEGPEKAGEMLESLVKRFPDVPEVTRATESFYDRWASDLVRRKEWQAAVDVYTKALERFPNDKHLVNNATVTWDQWAKTFFKAKDWEAAIQVYEKALQQFPDHKLLKQNLVYCKKQKKK
jgi:tetratricopeptide (TPR) repeat protein